MGARTIGGDVRAANSIGDEPILLFDLEIEKTIRRNRAKNRTVGENPRITLRDYFTPSTNITTSIVNPPVEANNFELKPGLIQMVQNSTMFRGALTKDPNAHLKNFVRVSDSIKCNGVTPEAIRMQLFPWSLADKATTWLDSLPDESITTWDGVKQKFLNKYFPPGKDAKIQAEITNFSQFEEAWERLQDKLRSCPHHGFEKWQILEILYNGLSSQNRRVIDSACGGSILNKEPAEVYNLVAEITADSAQWATNDRHFKKPAGMYKVNVETNFDINLDAISKQIETLMKAQVQPAPIAHSIDDGLSEEANFLGQKKSELRSGMQDSFVRYMEKVGHPCMGVLSNYMNKTDERLQSIEDLIKAQGQRAPSTEEVNYIHNPNRGQNDPYSNTYNQVQEEKKLEANDVLVQFMEQTNEKFGTLEGHISSILTLLSQRTQGSLPTQTEPNPKEKNEHCKVVTLRSGKELNQENNQDGQALVQEKEALTEGSTSKDQHHGKNKDEQVKVSVPFPQRLRNDQHDKQFARFLEIFRKLHINIPFAEAISQMPKYAKFLKDIISNKKKLEGFETVKLNEECSDIVLKKLPPKLKDPGSFNIPCTIGSSHFEKALCDLGANFVVLDMEEDEEVPIFMGRPFLATGDAIIEVKKGKLTLKLGDEKVIFQVFNSLKNPSSFASCNFVQTKDINDMITSDVFDDFRVQDPLEKVLTLQGLGTIEGGEEEEFLNFLQARLPPKN
ncbi:uncharacterized protein LOC131604769 [Vicia villosa]|uniref:uncharacterized protein LOC131604769 n=1 Tax=Vicia villosa TaxID=3911 RepID=UPI00273AA609|nr:uncharacterized protein LOC131604769 [Vicia villosa]